MLRSSIQILVLAALALLATVPNAFAGALISNGTVKLGVADLGELNFTDPLSEEFRGVTYVPTDNDGTRGGCACEGWGAGAGGPTQFEGRANQANGALNVRPVSFSSTPGTAISVADVLREGAPALRVTHAFNPSPQTPNLYQIDITLRNLTADSLANVRYERIMDWDIEPTPTSEFVTINRGATPPGDLLYSDDNGFSDNLPFSFAPNDPPLDPVTANVNYIDKGPADHGARFTFDFGSLAPGAEKRFSLFYGAAGTEAAANRAVSAAALEMFSYGQPNTTDGATQGTPNTFIWGFRAVGGSAVIPPRLTLSPGSAENAVGDPHTATAELRTGTGEPVPGAKVLFIVTGANPRAATARTTDAGGRALFTYTGTNVGGDTITACFDSNDNDLCDRDEVTDTASKTYRSADSTPPDTPITSGPPAFGNDNTPTFTFTSTEPGSTFACSLDGSPFTPCSSPFTTPRLSGGRHTLAVRATDAAGNSDPTPTVYIWEIAVEWRELPRPVRGREVNVGPVPGSGPVFIGVRRRGGTSRASARASQKGLRFVPLKQARQIPVGSFLNTKRGTVRLVSATGSRSRRKRTQVGRFNGGVFQILQSRKRRARGLTELRLKGSSFRRRCRTGKRGKPRARAGEARAEASRRRRLSRRTVRRLRARARGRFRTRGRHSAATVRGTVWITTDRCDGTLTTVKRGKVAVRDFRRKRTITVRRGKRYLARALR